MEHESTSNAEINDLQLEEELEEGELSSSSDDGYNPISRPVICEKLSASKMVEDGQEDNLSDISDHQNRSSESSDSDSFSKKHAKKSKKLSLRVKPMEDLVQQQSKPNKFKIWSTGLQEEALMQTLQGCDVTNSNKYSRDVESYDYSIKYRLNGENRLKRRQSNNDSNNDNETKRAKCINNVFNKVKVDIKSRLGSKKVEKSCNDEIDNMPRHISDLNLHSENTNEEIATEIANKLCEEKDDLLLRVVNILGKELPVKLFEETQEIEKNGGMLTLNGMRRRTPGGIFLYLLKNNGEIRQEHRKIIFSEDKKVHSKEIKIKKNKNRDMKVEQLIKTLKKDNDTLAIRKDLEMSHLKPDSMINSQPPPPQPPPSPQSPADINRENSSDYDTHNMNMNVASSDKNNQKDQDHNTSYDDDFLDMHCDDMELF